MNVSMSDAAVVSPISASPAASWWTPTHTANSSPSQPGDKTATAKCGAGTFRGKQLRNVRGVNVEMGFSPDGSSW